jgi:hypothetical protein
LEFEELAVGAVKYSVKHRRKLILLCQMIHGEIPAALLECCAGGSG